MKKLGIMTILIILTSLPTMAQITYGTMVLNDFDELKTYDKVHVTLVKSDKNLAVVTGNDVWDISIENDEGRLHIKMGSDKAVNVNEVNVRLYHIENIRSAEATQQSSIITENILQVNN